MSDYDDPTMQLGWELFWEGHRLGKGVENRTSVAKRDAMRRFEEYLEINYNVNHDQD